MKTAKTAPPAPKRKPLWRLFEERWRDKCNSPCIGNRQLCSCWQWAVTLDNFNRKG